MASVIAGFTAEELIGYLSAAGLSAEALNHIDEVTDSVTHAYNKGKAVYTQARALYSRGKKTYNFARNKYRSARRTYRRYRPLRIYKSRKRRRI